MDKRIEFIGIPGSGKTTLSNQILDKLKMENIEVYSDQYLYKSSVKIYNKNKGLLRYIRFRIINALQKDRYDSISLYRKSTSSFLLENIEIINNLLHIIDETVPDRRKEFVLKYLLNDVYKLDVIRKYSTFNNLLLMDEGFVHRLLNIFMFSDIERNKKYINTFLQKVGYPKVLIYITCSPEESLYRMKNRTTGIPTGFKNYEKEELLEILSQMNRSCEKVINTIEENVKTIKVDSSSIEKDIPFITNSIIENIN